MVTQRTKTKPQILVLGSGIAGLSTALKLAQLGQVTVVSKAEISEGATKYAQGGVASVWSKTDSFNEHKNDTLIAGAGLCRSHIVDLCVEKGPTQVQELIDLGVKFTKLAQSESKDPTFSLHREGGHGKRRILHADDLTGQEIERALVENVRAHTNITVLEHHIAIDLITEGKLFRKFRKPGRCLGAYVLDIKKEQIITIAADVVVLATGGAGKVYLYTSNPDTATGDGIAIAHRAGARVANLEFIQFHPTCLYHPGVKTFLISEALRGEGAVLKTVKGDEFMSRYHAMGALAPRDIVARAIDSEMKRTGDKHVLLDCKNISDVDMRTKFPGVYETCIKHGIDPTHEAIPVVPAAHYTCGGVLVDENGLTNIENLYAVGEVACTGLHGANRLASNSLLEAIVFADQVYLDVKKRLSNILQLGELTSLPNWDAGRAVPLEEQIDIAANWLEARSLMWNYVGIVRSNSRLERAKRRLDLLKNEVNTYYWDYLLTKDLIELRNLLTVADLIVQCAILRKESLGLHYTVDYPETPISNHPLQDTIL